MIEGSRHLSPTIVLVVLALVATTIALVLRDRSGSTPSPGVGTSELREGVIPGAVTQAVLRAEELDTSPRVWSRIADCESGEWDATATPVPDSAEWAYGDGAGDQHFEGGLHFAPGTWEAFREPRMPEHAGRATPVSQMLVAERVLDQQGWQAWPVCSEKVGVR